MLFIAAVYIVGAIVAAGVTGGVRDEMDGIADIATIVFWPVVLMLWGAAKAFKVIYLIGRCLGR